MQIKDNHLLAKIKKGEEVLWINPGKIPFQEASENLPLTEEDIEEARKRLERFAPLLMKYFPEVCTSAHEIFSGDQRAEWTY